MKNKCLILVSILLTTKLFAGIKINQESNIDLKTTLSTDNYYRLSVASTVKPMAVFSSISARIPVKLKIFCNDSLLDEDSFLYNKNLKDKPTTLQLDVSNFGTICPSYALKIVLEPNGIELETSTPFYSFSLNNQGTTAAYIASERVDRSQEMLQIIASLSDLAESKEALYCTIKSYENEYPSLTEELIFQYSKRYAPYDQEKISCPVGAEGKLARNVSECERNPSSFDDFCLFYERYLLAKEWYYDSISRLDKIKELNFADTTTLKNELQEEISEKEKMMKEIK